MAKLSSWFNADPRRFCVLGVWLDLAGCGLCFLSLATGATAAELLAGVFLMLAGARAKVLGRDRFKRQRVSSRHQRTRTATRRIQAIG